MWSLVDVVLVVRSWVEMFLWIWPLVEIHKTISKTSPPKPHPPKTTSTKPSPYSTISTKPSPPMAKSTKTSSSKTSPPKPNPPKTTSTKPSPYSTISTKPSLPKLTAINPPPQVKQTSTHAPASYISHKLSYGFKFSQFLLFFGF